MFAQEGYVAIQHQAYIYSVTLQMLRERPQTVRLIAMLLRVLGLSIAVVSIEVDCCKAPNSTAVVCADKYVTGGGPQAAEKARILLKLMQFIGAVSGGKTVTQVGLNYLMCKGERAKASMCGSMRQHHSCDLQSCANADVWRVNIAVVKLPSNYIVLNVEVMSAMSSAQDD